MERREQYDPEDIESLLNERSFDELLEEERAYVLRHLTGRDEYEAMRTLLHQVHKDERDEGPILAPPEVRNHVLNVFRQQQQPQWRVWLNSVGAMLWPKEMSALWRPALALGSVALLITAGVFVFRQSEEGHSQLAELRPAKEVELEKHGVVAPSRPVTDSARGGSVSTIFQEQSNEAQGAEAAAQSSTPEPGNVTFSAPVATQEFAAAAEATYEAATGSSTANFDLSPTAVAADAIEEKGLSLDDERSVREEVDGSVPHEVTERELISNVSTANATGRVRAVTKGKADAWKKEAVGSRSLNDDAALVSLISSGW